MVDGQARSGSPQPRAHDDVDVREEETDAGIIAGGRIEWGVFAEGEYVESILIDRARAMVIYRDLGKALGVTSRTPEALCKAEVLIATDIIKDDAGCLAEIRAALAEAGSA
jgi:hypothetical protein